MTSGIKALQITSKVLRRSALHRSKHDSRVQQQQQRWQLCTTVQWYEDHQRRCKMLTIVMHTTCFTAHSSVIYTAAKVHNSNNAVTDRSQCIVNRHWSFYMGHRWSTHKQQIKQNTTLPISTRMSRQTMAPFQLNCDNWYNFLVLFIQFLF